MADPVSAAAVEASGVADGSDDGITLKAKGPRVVVTAEKVPEIQAAWQQQLDDAAISANNNNGAAVKVTTLDIGHMAWSREMLELLQDFLMEHVVPTIATLLVDDIIASLPTEQGLATMEFLGELFREAPHLVKVNLADNALGIRAVERLCPFLEARPLHTLNLDNCGLSHESAKLLATSLRPDALACLLLGRNQMGPEGAKHFATLVQRCGGTLESIDYNGSRAMASGTYALATALQACPKLKRCNLNDCVLNNGEEPDTDPVVPLVVALEQCPQLQELVLPATSLQPSGVALVLDALRQSGAQLRILDLSGNELEEDGAQFVAQFLQDTPQPCLQQLILEGNQLELAGLEHLVPFLQAQPTACPNLRKLDLSDNILERDSALLLLQHLPPLSDMTLTELWLVDNDLSIKTAARLKARYQEGSACVVHVSDDDMLGDDDDEEEQANDNDQVDELAEQLQQAQLE